MRLGFLGTGWIGLNRMDAILASGAAEAVAVYDPNPAMAKEALSRAPDARLCKSLPDMFELGLDGIVIATPSALHSEQCIEALNAGVAVFCQKPLGRDAREVEAVLDAASRSDRLLGVDLSYRYTAAMHEIREQVRAGALGKVFAADLVFHNAYGPQSAWFWDPQKSGGGCLIDLGVHLVDLALWLLDFPAVEQASGRLFRDGRPRGPEEVEDYAIGSIDLVDGTSIRITCSWNASAGTDADIRATFHGSEAGAEMRNQRGSFYDFTSELFRGRERELLVAPPDEWGGRAAVEWARKLAAGERFAGSTSGLLATARTIDRLYHRDWNDVTEAESHGFLTATRVLGHGLEGRRHDR
jgi:predicted dehydrogenase